MTLPSQLSSSLSFTEQYGISGIIKGNVKGSEAESGNTVHRGVFELEDGCPPSSPSSIHETLEGEGPRPNLCDCGFSGANGSQNILYNYNQYVSCTPLTNIYKYSLRVTQLRIYDHFADSSPSDNITDQAVVPQR